MILTLISRRYGADMELNVLEKFPWSIVSPPPPRIPFFSEGTFFSKVMFMMCLQEELSAALKEVLSGIKLTERGVFVQASTLGSLEALLEFLRTSKIPVRQPLT